MEKATLTIDVEYDPNITDAESVASALDTLMETALSTPDILDEYGNPRIGDFYVKKVHHRTKCKFCGTEDYPSAMHLHNGGYVCDNCWDERLRATE